jgi:hypothetical protein
MSQQEHTPLNCVERVTGLQVHREDTAAHVLSIGLELEVNGIGHWAGEISVHLPRS